jgi:hypothetical protein
MAKTPAALTSPKIKKLAAKAEKSPSMLTTVETRELGAAVSAYLSAPKDSDPAGPKKSTAKTTAAKKSPAKKS